MSSVAYNLLFQEFIENVKSYRNNKLCTQIVPLKIGEILV